MGSTFLVTTLNRPDDLRRCIETIVKQTVSPGEVVVVDASDESAEAVVRPIVEGAGIALNYLTSTPGRTRQLNIGARAAVGDPVCIVDDDAVLYPDFNAGVLRTFSEAGADVGGVHGTMVGDTYRSAFRRLFRRAFLLSRHTLDAPGRVLPSGYYTVPIAPSSPTPVEAFRLGGCAFRRHVFDEYRFDESLEGYAFKEDVDFSYRVGKKYRLLVTPYARFEHLKSPAARIDERAKARMHLVNNYRLFRKNIPQSLPNRVAFAWASLGWLFYSALRSARARRTDHLRGTVRGIVDIVTGAANDAFQ